MLIVILVGSIICASANHSYVFIIGRTVAGLGAAGVLQGALAIITHLIPLAKRQIYIGIVVSVFGFSACGGPILGGVLSDRCGWRWCFWMFVSEFLSRSITKNILQQSSSWWGCIPASNDVYESRHEGCSDSERHLC